MQGRELHTLLIVFAYIITLVASEVTMTIAYIILAFITLVASFIAGAQYGRAIEQAVQAELVSLKSRGDKDAQVLTTAEQQAVEAFKKL